MTWKLALIDDHLLFRDGLRAVIAGSPDFKIVAEASEARGAYAAIEKEEPDVVVLDLALPGASGISVAREILRRDSRRKVFALTMYLDEEHVAQALEAGILGYASKEQGATEVLEAIRTVARGRSYLSPLISRFVVDEYLRMRRGGGTEDTPLRVLTQREREIFDLTVRGLSNDRIAEELDISKRTVETHRSRVLKKLSVHSASDLVRLAARHGLLRA
jgi:DNA-binding NarL/FixJ family response regulator